MRRLIALATLALALPVHTSARARRPAGGGV
jgi:hypothetical protein